MILTQSLIKLGSIELNLKGNKMKKIFILSLILLGVLFSGCCARGDYKCQKALSDFNNQMNKMNRQQTYTYQAPKVISGSFNTQPIGNSRLPSFGGGTNKTYTGTSGTKYQYDLSNQNDSLNYSTDIDAQRRDSMKLPSTNIDTLNGQDGGGIYE